MNALYLIGPPGSGKSTVMTQVQAQLDLETGPWRRLRPDLKGEFRAEPLLDMFGREVGLSLGITRPEFSGTDALSMSTHPEACTWAEELPEEGRPPLVLGEGARLSTKRFLTALDAVSDLTVGYLYAPADVLDARCAARETGATFKARRAGARSQSGTFRRGAATRAVNLRDALRDELGVRVLSLDTTKSSPAGTASMLVMEAGL